MQMLRGQHSDALIHNDTERAAILELKMKDVKEMAFQTIHADLLLGDFELKALGVDTKYGRDRWNEPYTANNYT